MIKGSFTGQLINPVFTSTLTGSGINDFDFNNADLVRMNNATLSVITGLKAGYPGQRVTFVSIGAGVVHFTHQDASSVATNRLINICTSDHTNLAAGSGFATYQYDDTTARWRLVDFDQGGPLTYSVTWKGSVSDPAIGNGTLTGSYYLRSRVIDVAIQVTLGSTTTLGSGVWFFSIPIVTVGTPSAGSGFITTGGGTTTVPCTISYTGFFPGIFGISNLTGNNVSNSAPAGITTGDTFRLYLPGLPVA